MRWDQKRREQASSNHFLMYAPLSGPLRSIHEVIQRSGRKETEMARRGKEGNEKERDRSSQ